MSHPDPLHDPENERIDDNPRSPSRVHRSPTDKSLARRRKKVALSMKGMYPGFAQDMLERMRKNLKKK